jgi:hypothetical protein
MASPGLMATAGAARAQPQSEGGGLGGLGWVIGKAGKAAMLPLAALDYPRGAVTATIRQALDTDVAEGFNKALAGLPGVEYTPIREEGEEGWDWGDLWSDIKGRKGFKESIVEPAFAEGAPHNNAAWKNVLGFGGDVAADPFTYLIGGTGAVAGKAARADYVATLRRAQREAAETLARTGAADDAARVARLGGDEAAEKIMRRGVNVANREQLQAMSPTLEHGIRLGHKGPILPGTENISYGISRALGPVKGAISAGPLGRGARALSVPRGYLNQDMRKAMERLIAGKGTMTADQALGALEINQVERVAGNTFGSVGARFVDNLARELKDTPLEERQAMVRAAEEGGEQNILTAMPQRMREAGVAAGAEEMPELEGYVVPHVMSRDAFRWMNKLKKGENPAVDTFRRVVGIKDTDLLEEGGFLLRRRLKPTTLPDGSVEPLVLKLGKEPGQEIEIVNGSLSELEDKLGGYLRAHGFEGSLYEQDPVAAWRRYVESTKRDVARRTAAKFGTETGLAGFRGRTGAIPGRYDPVGGRVPVASSVEGEPERWMAVENPKPKPEDTDFFEWKTDTRKTESRNRKFSRKKGNEQRAILKDLQFAGEAERTRVAGALDTLGEQVWAPIAQEKAAARRAGSQASNEIFNAVRAGQRLEHNATQIAKAIAESEQEERQLLRRIGGLRSGTQRRIKSRSKYTVDELREALDQVRAERARLETEFEAATERAKGAEFTARRQAKEVMTKRPELRTRDLTNARDRAAVNATKSRRIAREERIRRAMKRPDNPKPRWRYIEPGDARAAQEAMHVASQNGELEAYQQIIQQDEEVQRLLSRKMGDHADLLDEIRKIDAKIGRMTGFAKSDAEADRRMLIQEANQIAAEVHNLRIQRGNLRSQRTEHPLTAIVKELQDYKKQEEWINNFAEDVYGQHVSVPNAEARAKQTEIDLNDWQQALAREAEFQATPPVTAALEDVDQAALDAAERTLATDKSKKYLALKRRASSIEAQLPQAQKAEKPIWKRSKGEHILGEWRIKRVTPEDGGKSAWRVLGPGEVEPVAPAVRATVPREWTQVEGGRYTRGDWKIDRILPEGGKARQRVWRITDPDGNVTNAASLDAAKAQAGKMIRTKAAPPTSDVGRQAATLAEAKAMVEAETPGGISQKLTRELAEARQWIADNPRTVARVEKATATQKELQKKLAEIERNLPKPPERHPFFGELEAHGTALINQARDQAAVQQKVAEEYVPQIAETITGEKTARAALGRAETQTAGVALEEAAAVRPKIAGARGQVRRTQVTRERLNEIAASIDEANTKVRTNYTKALQDQEAARVRHAEISEKAKPLSKPTKATAALEGKRKGVPFGSKLDEVAAGNLLPYEVQPLHRTISDIDKVLAANPTGDDPLMGRIAAALYAHEEALDRLTTELDLPAHKLDTMLKAAQRGELAPVLKAHLKSDLEYIYEGGDFVIEKDLKHLYFSVAEQLDSKIFGRFLTAYTNFFKTYATMSPGFHVRNALSAFFMNSSESVTVQEQYWALRLWRKYANADDPLAWLERQSPPVQDAFRATFASGASQFTETGVSRAAGTARRSERAFNNMFTRGSQRFGQDWVEGPARLALGLNTTRHGGTLNEAMNRITRIHFDYSQVSKFDEQMKRLIPFWTFMSRNVPLQFTQMWMKPRSYLHFQSFARNFAAEPPEFFPEYIAEAGGFDTGLKTPEWLSKVPIIGPPAGMPIAASPDLPHLRLQDDIQRVAGALGGENPAQVLSDFNPAFTAPAEFLTNQDFFTGRQYDETDVTKANAAMTIPAMLMSLVGGAKRNPETGDFYTKDSAVNALRSLNPLLDRQMRLFPGVAGGSTSDPDRLLESWLRFGLGVPGRTISQDQMQGEAARRFFEQQDRAKAMQAMGG